MHPESQAEIVWRLQTAAGHLRAVSELVETGRPCEEVIHQLRAVNAALRVVGTRLLICRLKESEEIIINGSIEVRTSELARLHGLYTLWVQQPDNKNEVNECLKQNKP